MLALDLEWPNSWTLGPLYLISATVKWQTANTKSCIGLSPTKIRCPFRGIPIPFIFQCDKPHKFCVPTRSLSLLQKWDKWTWIYQFGQTRSTTRELVSPGAGPETSYQHRLLLKEYTIKVSLRQFEKKAVFQCFWKVVKGLSHIKFIASSMAAGAKTILDFLWSVRKMDLTIVHWKNSDFEFLYQKKWIAQ
jgi:hypothetical protein